MTYDRIKEQIKEGKYSVSREFLVPHSDDYIYESQAPDYVNKKLVQQWNKYVEIENAKIRNLMNNNMLAFRRDCIVWIRGELKNTSIEAVQPEGIWDYVVQNVVELSAPLEDVVDALYTLLNSLITYS